MDEQDVFSAENEAVVCELVLGDSRHGLTTVRNPPTP